jgi:hypothetical protein
VSCASSAAAALRVRGEEFRLVSREQEGQASSGNPFLIFEYSFKREQPPGDHGSGFQTGSFVQTRLPPPAECCRRPRQQLSSPALVELEGGRRGEEVQDVEQGVWYTPQLPPWLQQRTRGVNKGDTAAPIPESTASRSRNEP